MTDPVRDALAVPPGGITPEFMATVLETLSLRERPVEPNAIWNCIRWGLEEHRKLARMRDRMKELANEQ